MGLEMAIAAAHHHGDDAAGADWPDAAGRAERADGNEAVPEGSLSGTRPIAWSSFVHAARRQSRHIRCIRPSVRSKRMRSSHSSRFRWRAHGWGARRHAPFGSPALLDVVRRWPLIDLLNETVRQHGSLVWVFHHATGRSAGVGLSFMSGGNGRGCGAPGQPRPEGVDVEKLLGKTAVPTAPTNPLDAPLADRGGLPYAFFDHPSVIRDLATAVRVPIGFESGLHPPRIAKSGVPVRGNRLGDVLQALTEADPSFEWRVLDGVAVIRPRKAR